MQAVQPQHAGFKSQGRAQGRRRGQPRGRQTAVWLRHCGQVRCQHHLRGHHQGHALGRAQAGLQVGTGHRIQGAQVGRVSGADRQRQVVQRLAGQRTPGRQGLRVGLWRHHLRQRGRSGQQAALGQLGLLCRAHRHQVQRESGFVGGHIERQQQVQLGTPAEHGVAQALPALDQCGVDGCAVLQFEQHHRRLRLKETLRTGQHLQFTPLGVELDEGDLHAVRMGLQVVVQGEQLHRLAPFAGTGARIQFAVVADGEAGLPRAFSQAGGHHGDAVGKAVALHAAQQVAARQRRGLEGPDVAGLRAARDLQRKHAVVRADVQRMLAGLQQAGQQAHFRLEPVFLLQQHVGRQAGH